MGLWLSNVVTASAAARNYHGTIARLRRQQWTNALQHLLWKAWKYVEMWWDDGNQVSCKTLSNHMDIIDEGFPWQAIITGYWKDSVCLPVCKSRISAWYWRKDAIDGAQGS